MNLSYWLTLLLMYLNILTGIHELPQLVMCWDSDEFIGAEGFKEMIPKHCFMTPGKYLHLADPTTEDWNDLLCNICLLVTHLEQKFAKEYTSGKNITVDEGLVKFNGRLSLTVHANVHTNRKDNPSDLKWMKRVPGEVQTCQRGSLVVTMWRD